MVFFSINNSADYAVYIVQVVFIRSKPLFSPSHWRETE